MDYAHDPRTFLYSHYVSRGIRTATGVIGLTLLALLVMVRGLPVDNRPAATFNPTRALRAHP